MKSPELCCSPTSYLCDSCRKAIRETEKKIKLLNAYTLSQKLIKPGLRHVEEVCKEVREELELMRVGLEGESA